MRLKLLYAFACLIGLILIGLPNSVYAQAPIDEEIMTPSPKASAFMKYGEYPVSLYTGLVDITIPIYTIERCGVTVPIEFKYHASGLKYDDVSMELGMGWTLNAGGVVTRSVKGAFGNGEGRDINHLEICSNYTTFQDYEMLRKISDGTEDGEIDMYTYALPNQSGSFCFPSLNSRSDNETTSVNFNADHGLFIPNNGMRASFAYGNGSVTLLDTEGVSYTFELNNSDASDHYQEYHLTQITSADGVDAIIFTYDWISRGSANYIKRPYANCRFSYTNTVYPDGHIGSIPAVFDEGYDNGTGYSGGTYHQEMRPPRLIKIDFRGGRVEFEYAVKNQLETWDLRTINIFNNVQTAPLQTISLLKTELLSTSTGQKFGQQMLDKATFSNSQGDSYCYEFGYHSTPHSIYADSSMSAGFDYWGYFNGANTDGGHYVAKFTLQRHPAWMVVETRPYTTKGTDRTPNFSHAQMGVLNKIVYPTKGYTEFTYEPHRARVEILGSSTICGGLRIMEIKNYLQDGTLAERKWYKYGENGSGLGFANDLSIEDFRISSLNLVTALPPPGFGGSYYLAEKIYKTTYLSLPKRNNLLSGSPAVYEYVTEYTGGMNDNEVFYKTIYQYEKFQDQPMPATMYVPGGMPYVDYAPDTYQRTYQWEMGNLKSKKIYKKEGGEYALVSEVINTYEDINKAEFRNLRVTQYASHTPLNSSDYQFMHDPCRHRDLWSGCICPYNHWNYYITTGQRLLTYSIDITDGALQTTTYSYNSKGLPKKITKTQSNGDNVRTEYTYTTDYPSDQVYSKMIAKNMISPLIMESAYQIRPSYPDKHMYNSSTVYQKTLSPNPELYAKNFNEISYYDQTGIWTKSIAYLKYDKFGNVLYLRRPDHTDVVYLWSYDSLYPVIEVQNATYQQVENILGASVIQSLASNENPSLNTIENYADSLKSGLPDAFVTYHTFEPLIGVKTMTDPSGRTIYYNHDHFGRLLSVTDDEGKLVEGYEYHYSNVQ